MIKSKILIGFFSIIILSGIGLGVYFGIFYAPNNEPKEVVLTIENSDTIGNYTLQDLNSFESVTGYAGYRKTTGTLVGPDLYKGVLLEDLVEEVGGLSANQELEIVAGDEYQVTFTKEMLNGQFSAYDNITGEYLGVKNFRIIVAYEKNSQSLPSSDGVLRIACLADEGEGYLSDSSLWVKDVKILKVINSVSWNVYLYGAINDSLDKDVFEAFMYMNDAANLLIYQLLEGDRTNTYEGLALWRIVGLIDDEDPYTYNETLANSGYTLVLKNEFDANITLNSIDISLNDSYILAAKKNGVFLSNEQAPLMLVGPAVQAFQMIVEINEINLEF